MRGPTLRRMFTALIGIVALLLIAVLGYMAFDAAVSLSYARQEQQNQRERVVLLRSLLGHTAGGWTRSQLVNVIREHYAPNNLIKEEVDSIQVDGVVFVIRDDVVVRVMLFGEEEQPASER